MKGSLPAILDERRKLGHTPQALNWQHMSWNAIGPVSLMVARSLSVENNPLRSGKAD